MVSIQILQIILYLEDYLFGLKIMFFCDINSKPLKTANYV